MTLNSLCHIVNSLWKSIYLLKYTTVFFPLILKAFSRNKSNMIKLLSFCAKVILFRCCLLNCRQIKQITIKHLSLSRILINRLIWETRPNSLSLLISSNHRNKSQSFYMKLLYPLNARSSQHKTKINTKISCSI